MKTSLLALVGVFLLAGRTLASETIYENSANYLAQYADTTLETGDQVQFAGTGRLIDFFSFEYFAVLGQVPSGNETARVRFYLNDGATGANPGPSPSSLLYDSGPFTITAGYRTVDVSDIAVFVPTNSITWTVQFAGLSANEHAGLLFYDPPQTGSSDNYIWQKDTNGWAAVAYDGVTNNFAARFTALPEVRIASLQVRANAATLVVTAASGKYYHLEYKNDADQTGWTAVNLPAVLATTNTVTLVDSTLAGARFRVYRVVQTDTAVAAAVPSRPGLWNAGRTIFLVIDRPKLPAGNS